METTMTSTLNDICYEQIKDNFYYGKFGDFNLVIDKNTGCFNATKLCQLSPKKRFADWTKLSRSQELLDYYNKKSFRMENSPAWNYEIKIVPMEIARLERILTHPSKIFIFI
jgi:hypothetical protein